ncbi:molybdopterin-dependent oxidoreductase [Gordonibacter sp.]|uniref:molybdopterin-dependent oxidoreductase n=3 Tax=Gordonibacter sp. TaxID=1968902 RepID=UPI002FC7B25D
MMNEGVTKVPHEKPFRYVEGDLTVTRGSAWSGPGCHDGCGVLMYTDAQGELVRVEGDPENPYNQGRLCVRCLALTEAVNNKDRLRYPMIRKKEDRGKDAWERISWDEAYNLIEEKLNYYKENFGAESVMFWKGTGRDIATYLSRFAWSFGSPNLTSGINGIACYAPRVFGCTATSGSFWVGDYSQQFADRYDNPNWKMPGLIVVWGNNPLISNSDGLYGHWVVDCMKRGSKLMVIDPKCTWLAAKAELWLQIRPGTDAALAMSMANVMIEEGIYDQEFVDCWCYGFEEYAERVAPYTAEKTSGITWVPEEDIRRAARLFAQSEGTVLQWGVAVDQTTEALPACQALSSLVMITGNLDNPGGMIRPPEMLMYMGGWGMEFLPPEQEEKRIGINDYSFYRTGVVNAASRKIMEALETGKPYPIKAAWIQTTDLITGTAPDPLRTKRNMETLDFVVGVDLFMTATMMAFADVLLPAAAYPERNGIRVGDGCQRGETINKAVDGGECKADMEILLDLGKRFNPEAWPWDTVEDMYSHILKGATGLSFEELQQDAPVYLPYEYYKYKTGKLRSDGNVGFNTRTGRVELYSLWYESLGLDPLPQFSEPTPSPYATPELYEEYPLIIITGPRMWGYFHSENRRQEHLRAIQPEPTIEMHPDTAMKYGVSDGEWVWVEGHRGRAKRVVATTPTLDPRVVSTSHGWSHPEEGAETLFGMEDLNINKLIAWEDMSKIGVGANYKTMLCKIYKV